MSQIGEEEHRYNKRRKADWIGQTLRSKCLLKHIVEGKVEKVIEVTGRRGRRLEQLLET